MMKDPSVKFQHILSGPEAYHTFTPNKQMQNTRTKGTDPSMLMTSSSNQTSRNRQVKQPADRNAAT